jgi:hypothetical protein
MGQLPPLQPAASAYLRGAYGEIERCRVNKQEARKIALAWAASIIRVEADNGEALYEEAERNGSTDPENDAAKIGKALEEIAASLLKRGAA